MVFNSGFKGLIERHATATLQHHHSPSPLTLEIELLASSRYSN